MTHKVRCHRFFIKNSIQCKLQIHRNKKILDLKVNNMLCCGNVRNDDETPAVVAPMLPVTIPTVKLVNKEGLELVQLQAVFRHGARTPLNLASGLPEATYERHLGLDLPEADIPHQVVNFLDGRQAGPSLMEQDLREARLKGGCRPSVLTTLGQKEMINLGRKIKETYLPALRLDTFSPQLISFRSTHVERTIKSLKCVLVGMFGKLLLTKLGPIKIPVKDIWDEDIFPNKLSCPALRLAVGLTLANLDSIPDYSNDKRLVMKSLGLPPEAPFDFSSLKDDLSSRVAHGNTYPKVMEPHRERVELQSARVLRAITTGYIDGGPPREEVLIMSIGRLMHGLLTNMEDVVCGVVKPRLYLFSGHDTTLAPLLEAIGLAQPEWPPYASCILFELYKSRELIDNNQFLVRVLYNWKEQVLPCYPESVLVPFSVVRSMMSRCILTPGEFRRMCSSGGGVA